MATATQNTGPAHLIDSAGLPSPSLGMEVNRALLIAFTPKEAARDGSYAWGVGLFVRNGEYDPYVVWMLILRPDGAWSVQSGTYCQTITEGVEHYRAQGGAA